MYRAVETMPVDMWVHVRPLGNPSTGKSREKLDIGQRGVAGLLAKLVPCV
jgi:hypothetical protein